MSLKACTIVGGKGLSERVENDFYATDPKSVIELLETYKIEGKTFYEPCVGQGHIAKVLKEYYPKSKVLCSDIVDRGYHDVIISDFLKDDLGIKVDWVITNPPFKRAKEFAEKSLEISKKGVAMFLRIQFLEGQSRKAWLQSSPLKYIYVFSKRQQPFRDGLPINPKTGKKWSSVMCFAWFIWEKGYIGEPVIRWI